MDNLSMKSERDRSLEGHFLTFLLNHLLLLSPPFTNLLRFLPRNHRMRSDSVGFRQAYWSIALRQLKAQLTVAVIPLQYGTEEIIMKRPNVGDRGK